MHHSYSHSEKSMHHGEYLWNGTFFMLILCTLVNYGILGFNVDVICSFVLSNNRTLEEILQLGEVEAGLGLTAPADQHQLITVDMSNKREGESLYNTIVPLNNSTAEYHIINNTVVIYRHNNQYLFSPIVIIIFSQIIALCGAIQ